MSNFRPIDRDTGFLMPPSVDEWLPQQHLARFVVEVIAGLDLRAMTGSYRGSGEASYHPGLLLGIADLRLLPQGCFPAASWSGRPMTRWRSASSPPTSILTTTRSPRSGGAFLSRSRTLFVQVLVLAREMGVLKMGTVALDGTKIHANASRHSALSYEHAGKIEAQLQAEVAELMAKAEAADQADIPDGMSIPDELARREERLAKLAEARATIEARAKERFAREQADHRGQARGARRPRPAATGKKPGGKPPAAAGGGAAARPIRST